MPESKVPVPGARGGVGANTLALGDSPALRGLGVDVLEALAAAAVVRRPPEHAVLASPGEIATSLAIVLEGEVRQFEGSEGGDARPSLGAGGVVGASLIVQQPERMRAEAGPGLSVVSWTRAELSRVFRAFPRLEADLRTRLSLGYRLRELVEQLRQAPLFRGVSPVLVREFLQRATLMRFEPGELVCKEGEAGSSFFLVVSGEVRVFKRGKDDPAVDTLARLARGESFGEISLLRGGVRVASVVAVAYTELLCLERPEFERIYHADVVFRRSVERLAKTRLELEDAAEREATTVVIVNRSGHPAAHLASLLEESLNRTRPGRAVLAPQLGPSATTSAADFRIVCAPTPREEAAIFAELLGSGDQRLPTIVWVTRDGVTPLPDEVPAASRVIRLELKGTLEPAATTDTRGRALVLRCPPPVDPATVGARLSDQPEEVREGFARVGRALTRTLVGVALGGGAAWGFAHIPLLRGLVDAGIPIDMVAGTSVGSLMGFVFASRGVAGLDKLIELRRTMMGCLALFSVVPGSSARYLASLIADHERIEDLPITFRPVALNILTGVEHVFRSGSSIDAVRASGALPGIFAPVLTQDARYIDGGFSNNVPVTALVEEGADFVIASNVVPPLTRQHYRAPRNGVDAWMRQLWLPSRVADGIRAVFHVFHTDGNHQAAMSEATFAPDLAQFQPYEFLQAEAIAAAGAKAVPNFVKEVAHRYASFCDET